VERRLKQEFVKQCLSQNKDVSKGQVDVNQAFSNIYQHPLSYCSFFQLVKFVSTIFSPSTAKDTIQVKQPEEDFQVSSSMIYANKIHVMSSKIAIVNLLVIAGFELH